MDLSTGDSSVTVSRTLKDGKSVIALDLKVTSLQMILDRSGKIVVHSENSYLIHFMIAIMKRMRYFSL